MPTAPTRKDFPRSSSSAATRASGFRGRWNTPGSCGSCCGRAIDRSTLGGWANPHADPERQVDYLAAENFHAEFYLTQVVSHHHAERVEEFIAAAERRGLTLPGLFGVFYYRSANPRTLEALNGFLPVPAEGLTRDFA